ncbi:LysR family transcriptional regulator [Paraburkholderia sp. FT54]|jgi:DNA-binding transcriptional LysR family regulator|uniref:LysR family transcriptional regulator n=1 Tax=Paraburkholderia sp. FT54 TaxID=3074437 RepID=UPI002877BC51|nr:LysR family transcriptional regulator [Paraburkholderia sp. FT54]WNC93443.1 LysR family transcriptional regulator [Paraburkholderia sp. FT54]
MNRFPGVDLDALRAFVAVASHASFNDAAIELNLSASALTRRIKRLEEALDATLFERTTRTVALTSAGELLLPRAQGVLRELDASLELVSEATRIRTGQLTIACIPTVAKFMLPKIVGSYHKRRPEVRLRLIEANLATVVQRVAIGEAEFGIAFLVNESPELAIDELLVDPYVLACPADHPLAASEHVTWPELRPWPLIVSGTSSGNRRMLDAALRDIDWRPDRLIEIEHLTTSLGLVEAGLGISIIPRCAAPRDAHARIAIRPLVDPTVARTIGLIRRRDAALSSIARDFRLALRRMAPFDSSILHEPA